MNAKWAIAAIVVIALGVALWASDKITYEGERTIYTVRCEQGNWEGLACKGTMVAGDRYRFRASVSKQEVLYWVVGSSQPSGKFSQCQVKDRGNWECDEAHGPAAHDHALDDERPPEARGRRRTAFRSTPFRSGCGGCSSRASTSTARRGTSVSRPTSDLGSRHAMRPAAGQAEHAIGGACTSVGGSAARIAALADVPMRFAPASSIARASSRLRIPPDALTPMPAPTAARIRRTSAAVAPPAG